ncbi:hypothetical protein AB0D99_29755 [Streptomyces sp. NPDC047971]|uniref:hypothetical protein n=1 Tax=Streptomyces sp. NPDC047971 TaxID=3154499 RepID=UPI0034025ED0
MSSWDVEQVVGLVRGASIAEAIDVSDASEWTELDHAVRDTARHRPSMRRAPAWASDHPVRRVSWRWDAPLPSVPLSRRRSHPEPTETELALALCHPDGRIRQAALRRAEGVPALLPLVVIRCADWVEPVRTEARSMLRAALPGVGPEAIGVLASVVLRISGRQRGAAALDLLESALREAPAPVLDAVLVSEERSVRRLAHRLAVERGLFSPARLALIAASDEDVVIQDLAASGALAAVDVTTDDDVLRQLLRSRYPRVRSAGVTALRRAERYGEAEPFLTDRSPLVRACARYVLRQAGVDPVPLYRALCVGTDVPAGAPVGLAECGARDDRDLLWPLTRHPHDGVRARAVAGLRLLETADVARLTVLLDDPAPGVVRETATALLPWVRRLSPEELMERLAPDRPRHVRVGAFRLLAARGGEACGEAARRLSDDADARLRANARAVLGGWRTVR